MRKASLLILSLPESIRTPSSFFCFPSGFSRGSFLGGECSIQLSYEDMSDFWLKIGLSATFQASGSVTGYSITYAFWMNCSIQLSSIHSPLVASYITLTLTDSNYRVLFPIVQRRQASPFLRRGVLYPFNYGKLFSFIQYIRNKEDID